MPSKRKATTRTRCPKCGESVFRRGHARGKARYGHRQAQHLSCKWHGTEPVGRVKDATTGIPKETSRALKKEIHEARGRQVYVVTAAQNATPVHARALLSLKIYCQRNNAKLLVIPYRYKNPTSVWSQKAKDDDWWAKELTPYICGERVQITKNLLLMGDIMTQPTATRPLEGYETITGPQSGVFGHPKLELITIPTPQQRLPKLLTTTGAITRRNYINGRAGKKGEFHHTFGACVIEVDGDLFHVRQLNMKNDGSFCDLTSEYDGENVRDYDRIPALIMGDTHVNVIDPTAASATFAGPDSIVGFLRPEQIVWHDVHDGTAKNHHERGRAFHELVKYRAGQDNVEAEVARTFAFIDAATPEATQNIIVPSNHIDFLKEWIENGPDPRRDPQNAVFWCKTFAAIAESPSTAWMPWGVQVQDPFAYWGEKMLKCADRTKFLMRSEPYQIKNIEVGFHGDRGPGGVKGSLYGFRKIGSRSIIGHGHAPGIMDGAYQVGTTSYLNLSYASGSPSAWLHTHCVIYPNGKRSLVNIIEGKWRA